MNKHGKPRSEGRKRQGKPPWKCEICGRKFIGQYYRVCRTCTYLKSNGTRVVLRKKAQLEALMRRVIEVERWYEINLGK